MVSYLDYGLLGTGVYLLNSYIKKKRLPAPLPPGPRGLPIIGVSTVFPGVWQFINRCATECGRYANSEGLADLRRLGSGVWLVTFHTYSFCLVLSFTIQVVFLLPM